SHCHAFSLTHPAAPRPPPLSLHDALPILTALPAGATVRPSSCLGLCERAPAVMVGHELVAPAAVNTVVDAISDHGSSPHPDLPRSEEHTSELQSLRHLVCRLLLEKKKH